METTQGDVSKKKQRGALVGGESVITSCSFFPLSSSDFAPHSTV